jgi:hypothetical protein
MACEGAISSVSRKKVYTSNWYENKIGVVDLGQRVVTKKLPIADKPDGDRLRGSVSQGVRV